MWQERGSEVRWGYPMQNFYIHVLVIFNAIWCEYTTSQYVRASVKNHIKYNKIALKHEYKNSAWGIPASPRNHVPATRQME